MNKDIRIKKPVPAREQKVTKIDDKPVELNSGKEITIHSKQGLTELLSTITEADFRSIANLKESEKISERVYVVTCISELRRISITEKWNLKTYGMQPHLYNGEYWNPIKKSDFKIFLGAVAEKMGVPTATSQYYGFRDHLYKQFNETANTHNKTSDSRNRILINLKNGTFEISEKGGILRGFESEDDLTYQLNFDYDSTSTAPNFKSYLDRVLPDSGLQLVLAEFMGYIFAKHLKLEKCLLLYGSGANGKSVFFEIINALLGDENVSNFSLSNLAQEHNRYLIGNKLLNYGSDIRSKIDVEIFKLLVSGEPVQARLKYQNSEMLTNYARLCFNCNELPQDVEHNEAFFRRFIIIPFNVTIPEIERDTLLAKKIIDKELSGVFNWILEGLNRLLQNGGFSKNATINETLDKFKSDSNTVISFIDESGLVPSEAAKILFKDIFIEYVHHCRDNHFHQLGRRKFSEKLKEQHFQTERSGAGGSLYVLAENKLYDDESLHSLTSLEKLTPFLNSEISE